MIAVTTASASAATSSNATTIESCPDAVAGTSPWPLMTTTSPPTTSNRAGCSQSAFANAARTDPRGTPADRSRAAARHRTASPNVHRRGRPGNQAVRGARPQSAHRRNVEDDTPAAAAATGPVRAADHTAKSRSRGPKPLKTGSGINSLRSVLATTARPSPSGPTTGSEDNPMTPVSHPCDRARQSAATAAKSIWSYRDPMPRTVLQRPNC